MQRLLKIGRRFSSLLAIPSVCMLIGSLSIPAFAEDTHQLLISMKNDDKKAFLLAEKPLVTFTDHECVIDCKGFTSYFDMGDIKDIRVSDMTGVKEINADEVTLDFTDPSTAVVRGVPAGVIVTLYTLDGMMLESVRANDDGCATLNMAAVPPATFCIISINSIKNFKLYKK